MKKKKEPPLKTKNIKKNKQESLGDKFGKELSDLISEYTGKLNPVAITHYLIFEAKMEICCESTCFYHTLGVLTSMINAEMCEIWVKMNAIRSDKSGDKKNVSNSL
jgi:hypothetical protein